MPFLAAIPAWALVAGTTAMAAGSALYTGIAQKSAAERNAELMEQQAALNRELGEEATKEVHFQTLEAMSHARAQMGASGSSLASTSFVDIARMMAGRGAQRERMTRFGYQMKSWEANEASEQYETQGNQALMSGVMQAAGYVFSGSKAIAGLPKIESTQPSFAGYNPDELYSSNSLLPKKG